LKPKHIIAFGGDGLLYDPKLKLTAHFVLGLTEKSRPRICFVPTASGDSQVYVNAFKTRYTNDLCEVSLLKLFDCQVKDFRSFLLSQDAIYVGGGNTANMFAVWRVHGVDEIMREAHEAGIVLCGTSAGSICWFESGVTDSFGRDLAPMKNCLGFINGSNCPHYDTEALRQPQYRKFVKEGLAAGYAADDGAALHFVDGEFREAVSSKPHARAFHVALCGGEVVETPIPIRYLGRAAT
jgi:peptidase E